MSETDRQIDRWTDTLMVLNYIRSNAAGPMKIMQANQLMTQKVNVDIMKKAFDTFHANLKINFLA